MAEERRPRGSGSVYQRKDGLWVAAISVKSDGAKRLRLIDYATTETLADKKLLELRKKAKQGAVPTGAMTVNAWFAHWLDNVVVKELRPKTVVNYRSMVKVHILPVIGSVRIANLTSEHIRKVTNKVAATRASSTAVTVHWILAAALSEAERARKIDRNPVELTKPPRKKAPELEVLTTAEAKSVVLRARTETPGLEAYLWATFLLTGARRGEIIGLEWDRVTTQLDLTWQLQRYKSGALIAPADYESRHLVGGLHLTRPKSAAGVRVVPLVSPLSDILSDWRGKADPNPYGLVFSRDGQPLDPDWVSKEWVRVVAALGLEKHVRLHGLRHTAVDLMYEAGVPEDIIKAIVGHSTVAMSRAYRSRVPAQRLTDGMSQWAELLA